MPRPRVRGLLVPQFATPGRRHERPGTLSGDAAPRAVELMDQLLLELTAGNLALRDAMKPIQGKPQALFMVEFSGDDPAEVDDRVEKLHAPACRASTG